MYGSPRSLVLFLDLLLLGLPTSFLPLPIVFVGRNNDDWPWGATVAAIAVATCFLLYCTLLCSFPPGDVRKEKGIKASFFYVPLVKFCFVLFALSGRYRCRRHRPCKSPLGNEAEQREKRREKKKRKEKMLTSCLARALFLLFMYVCVCVCAGSIKPWAVFSSNTSVANETVSPPSPPILPTRSLPLLSSLRS